MPASRRRAVARTRRPAAVTVTVLRRRSSPSRCCCGGLLGAVDGFGPGRHREFAPYATATVVGELRRHFHDRTWEWLRVLLGRLPERSRPSPALRFSGGLAQHEIAERVGRSQMHVSRILRQSLDLLRRRLDEVPP